VEAGGPDPKGKASTESSRARSGHPMSSGPAPRPAPVGFMVDARRAQQSVVPHPHPPERQPVDKDGGWQLVSRCKQWGRVVHQPPPLRRPVATDLVACCFNYLR
jgi:hypothetical protein